MKFIFSYLKAFRWRIAGGMGIKLSATLLELMIPYVLETLIDTVAPAGDRGRVVLWGAAMILLAFSVRMLNVTANRMSVRVAKQTIFRIRRDLFHASLNLSGRWTPSACRRSPRA